VNILVIYGSLREKSINKALARAIERNAPEGMLIELMGIGGLPLYNEDDELTDYPLVAAEAKKKIVAADGVLIVTPEYNRAPPGALKNFLDWTSRPEDERIWSGKIVGVLGASNGMRGASFAQYDIRRIMGYFNAAVLGQPEYYLAQGDTKITGGVVSEPKAIEVLKKFLAAFKTFVERGRTA